MTRTEYKRLRESVGNQTEVAKKLGVKRETINRRESGATIITEEAAQAMEHLAHCKTPNPRKRKEGE